MLSLGGEKGGMPPRGAPTRSMARERVKGKHLFNTTTEFMDIIIPYNFEPRHYQVDLYNCIPNGYKRAVAIWHRRSGKDKTIFNILVKEAFKRVGSYYYFFPSYSQGRKIIWDGADRDGFRFLNHIPEGVRESTRNDEMKIRLKNGSLLQIVGSDNIDSIVGTNPVGCVFSEFSLQDPRGWDFVRPILAENDGWAIFNYTPRGHNHGFDLYEMAKRNPSWFCEVLTVDATRAISKQMIQDERESGMAEELIEQEFYCSFEAAIPGAYYAVELRKARDDGRITKVPVEDYSRVNTAWDLGMDDSTTIWFFQMVGREVHIVDYYEGSGFGLRHYADVLRDKKYLYGTHLAPHDIEVRELGTGVSRKSTAASLGIEFTVVPRMLVEDGINSVRAMLGKCWFDADRCSHGINCLSSYRKDYDEKNRAFKMRPVHDWSSHGADGFRTLATGLDLVGDEAIEAAYSYARERFIRQMDECDFN